MLEATPSDADLTNDLNLVEKLQKQSEEADTALEAKDFAKVYFFSLVYSVIISIYLKELQLLF